MKKIRLSLLAFTTIAIAFTSCKKDDETKSTIDVTSTNLKGVFITNEGGFGSSNGSVSYLDNSLKVTEDIFGNANSGRPAGDVVQSMTIVKDKAFIVVNGSKKIEVVSMKDFKSVGVINGFKGPRYALSVDSTKLYVTDWFDNNIKVIDPRTLTITKTISTGVGPENLIKIGNEIYVVNSGGWDFDKTVTVINGLTDNVTNTIEVGDSPNSLQVDYQGKLWILCAGKKPYVSSKLDSANTTAGKLVRLNTSTHAVDLSIDFNYKYDVPSHLVINKSKGTLYYLNGTIYKHDVSATTLSVNPIINKYFYGLAVNPSTDDIYGADPGSYTGKGYIFRYQPTGAVMDSIKVGIIPSGFTFSN